MLSRAPLRGIVPCALAFALASFCASAARIEVAANAAPNEITAVPPATYVAPPQAKSAPARPLVDAPARTIRLPAPNPADVAAAKAGRTGAADRVLKHSSRSIGFAREIPGDQAAIRGSDLSWVPVAGGRAARVDVQSPGAAAVRVAVSVAGADPAVQVRFAGSAAPGEVQGPYTAKAIAQAASRYGSYWSPVLDGDTATVELFAPAGVEVTGITLRIARLSHLVTAAAQLGDVKASTGIGASQSCEVDVACVATTALLNTAKSVAKMVFTASDGITYLCSGTLLNDSVTSNTPYFYTASHCIDSQYAASTLDTFWFFDATACGSKSTPAYVHRPGGAFLLARSEDQDWSLVRLAEMPPNGAQFSAWRADPLTSGQAANTMHHPEGDLKKWSQGTSPGYEVFDNGASYAQMNWRRGSTEPGSSGAGLFTLSGSGAFYELRGGLWGGTAACNNSSGTDYFSRLDRALPLLRQYLTPNVSNPSGESVAVEFYNARLDHYFISTNPSEINDLDTGVHPGWERTGLRFLAYGDGAQAPASATPVCRFYLKPGYGDSHFYSGDPKECADTAAKFGDAWIYESANVFYTVLPDRTTGACPAGFSPVYRFYNSVKINHRYTTERDVRDALVDSPGWIAEGYGPDAVIMCAPPT